MRERMGRPEGRAGVEAVLTPRQAAAAGEVVREVRRRVPAELAHALLFGSRARGTARPDSDVDILLIFRVLPDDREPQATIAEEIAERVAERTGVPVATWSVSAIDLACGMRTPMLVDALTDGIPLWPAGVPSPRLPFTPPDAVRCAGALLQRIEEGSEEAGWKRRAGDLEGAASRGRDDIVRMCTAALLLHGETRPRRAEAVERFREVYGGNPAFAGDRDRVLRWAAASFGPQGTDDERPVGPPPGGFAALFDTVDALRGWVAGRREEVARRIGAGGNGGAPGAYDQGNRIRRRG
jgi:predicted nucleotidyltransferase